MLSPEAGGKHLPQIAQSAVRNRLLAALPPDDFARLAPGLQEVRLERHQRLHEPDDSVEGAHFLESGVVSMLVSVREGDSIEVGVVGREGMVGLQLVLGDRRAISEAIVQLPGSALRLEAAELCGALEASPALRALLLRYVRAVYIQGMQTAACNGLHLLEQRLACWLLKMHDRAESDSFPITHEFISYMLGVRRVGVTIASGSLQRAGIIAHGHGRVTIRDRAALEALSCECYGIVRRHFERLLRTPLGER